MPKYKFYECQNVTNDAAISVFMNEVLLL